MLLLQRQKIKLYSWDTTDREQNVAYFKLKNAHAFTKQWGEKLQKELFPEGYLGQFINRPTNQANNFKSYTWAKIYPRQNAPKELAYTVGIEGDSGFVVKIDTVGNVGDKRQSFEELRGDYETSAIVALLTIDEGINKSLEDLVKWSIEAIGQFALTYDDVCVEVGLDDHDLKKMTAKTLDKGNQKLNQPLNRILFGAAGTGKTYNTINHALAILENKELVEIANQENLPNGRKKLKDRFDKLKREGRIKFVTFHQSFSYEDFVEGIRAETDDQGQLRYDVQVGVFKEICEKAKGTAQQKHHIDEVIDDFLAEITEIPLELKTQQNKKFTVTYLGSGLTLQCQPLASEANATYYANIGKIKSLLSGEEVDKAYNRSYIKAVAEYLKPRIQNQPKTNQSYVLIIDEINRGNISRIFGELITLIEDSKRQGADEELSVTLPYSKEEFSVPNNVYIIGTMNSSDRSLTGLDIALRRRFTFIEMPPQPKEIKHEDGELIKISGKDKNGNDQQVIVADLLSVMNQRIEVLLDRDHCIGHANFMSLRKTPPLTHLSDIFKQKIIPQLQEYFFDDWAKINLVFFDNKMIIEDQEISIAGLFPPNIGEHINYYEQKKIWKINEEAFETIDAFVAILGSKG